MSKIERSNQVGKFTEAELRAKVAESKKFWSSPAGQAEQRRLDAQDRKRKPVAIKFPELLNRGTSPTLVQASNPLVAKSRLLGKL